MVSIERWNKSIEQDVKQNEYKVKDDHCGLCPGRQKLTKRALVKHNRLVHNFALPLFLHFKSCLSEGRPCVVGGIIFLVDCSVPTSGEPDR